MKESAYADGSITEKSTTCLGLSGGCYLVPLGESLKQTGCYRIGAPCHWLNQFDYPYFSKRNLCEFVFEWPKSYFPHSGRCPAGMLSWKVAKKQKAGLILCLRAFSYAAQTTQALRVLLGESVISQRFWRCTRVRARSCNVYNTGNILSAAECQ